MPAYQIKIEKTAQGHVAVTMPSAICEGIFNHLRDRCMVANAQGTKIPDHSQLILKCADVEKIQELIQLELKSQHAIFRHDPGLISIKQ